MPDVLNFPIIANGPISKTFLAERCSDFLSAATFIKHLPYRRNTDKENLLTVFSDRHGTCSTKHALLRQLAVENDRPDIKLVLGIFRMNGMNTPKIAATLQRAGLEYIPEAHNYLKLDKEILDYTNSRSSAEDFANDLISEIEIEPEQITSFKVNHHKKILQDWLSQNQITQSLEEMWAIREQCIADLSTNSGIKK